MLFHIHFLEEIILFELNSNHKINKTIFKINRTFIIISNTPRIINFSNNNRLKGIKAKNKNNKIKIKTKKFTMKTLVFFGSKKVMSVLKTKNSIKLFNSIIKRWYFIYIDF